MFNADDVIVTLTKDQLFQHLSEYDIWLKYCSNFKEINKSFCSELYKDNNPSCRIQQLASGMLIYKDFGTGDTYSCFTYVMTKYGRTYQEALNIIANDFGLLKIRTKQKPLFLIGKEEDRNNKTVVSSKSLISIVPRNWNLGDYNYWNQYGITFDLLEEFDVTACKYVYLHKGNKTIVFSNTPNNPIYAYRFTYEGMYSYKIYKPLEPNKKYKWLFSGGSKENIEGFYQLPLFDDLLIITKSLKDCICYKILGINAISLQGEMNKLDNQLLAKLKYRFKEIKIQYDEDETGIKAANKLHTSHNLPILRIPFEYKSKDISDLIKNCGIKEAKILITEKWKLKSGGV